MTFGEVIHILIILAIVFNLIVWGMTIYINARKSRTSGKCNMTDAEKEELAKNKEE